MRGRGLEAPLGLEVNPVLVFLDDGLVGGIHESVVELKAVVPDHLALGIVGVGVDACGKGVVVVTSGRPLAEEGLAKVDIVLQGQGPVLGLWRDYRHVRSRGNCFRGLCRRLLGIVLGKCRKCCNEHSGKDDCYLFHRVNN